MSDISDSQANQPDSPPPSSSAASAQASSAETKAAEPAAAAPPSEQQHIPPAGRAPLVSDTPWAQTWKLIGARFRALSDKAGRRIMQRTLKIGISARIFHPESGAKGLRSKTLQYLEESIAQWVMSARCAGVHDSDRQYQWLGASE